MKVVGSPDKSNYKDGYKMAAKAHVKIPSNEDGKGLW